MSRDGIIAILGILRTAYPRFYANMTASEAEGTIALWGEMLGDIDIQTLTVAVKSLIAHFEYPPTISEVRKEVARITSSDNMTAIDAWNEAHKMICNGLYMTQAEFDKASPKVKRFFGSVRQLKELGMCDIDTVNTVVKGQFLKQYDVISEQENKQALMPKRLEDMVKQLGIGIGAKEEEE